MGVVQIRHSVKPAARLIGITRGASAQKRLQEPSIADPLGVRSQIVPRGQGVIGAGAAARGGVGGVCVGGVDVVAVVVAVSPSSVVAMATVLGASVAAVPAPFFMVVIEGEGFCQEEEEESEREEGFRHYSEGTKLKTYCRI